MVNLFSAPLNVIGTAFKPVSDITQTYVNYSESLVNLTNSQTANSLSKLNDSQLEAYTKTKELEAETAQTKLNTDKPFLSQVSDATGSITKFIIVVVVIIAIFYLWNKFKK
jgi:predicted PurR-regulated permease PerM